MKKILIRTAEIIVDYSMSAIIWTILFYLIMSFAFGYINFTQLLTQDEISDLVLVFFISSVFIHLLTKV
jgi:nicotinamide riboside transporter PnuC